MQIKKDKLISFLKEIDNELGSEIKLIAVGGTAMTLLGLKRSTIDVDFDLSEGDSRVLKRTLEIVPHGFRVDIFTNGLIFSQQLPDNYLDKAIPIKVDFMSIKLYVLNPIDIVVTKIGRLDDRDMQDIEACITRCKLEKEKIIERANQVEYIGNEKNYKINLKVVIKRFF